MSFDRVAPHYRWLETLVFGSQLQEARVAFVQKIESPQRVLVVGEGNGRFLAEFVRVHPAAEIDCVEASGRMIDLARLRVGTARVRFIQGDVRKVELPAATYDLIVTHFFLDCFERRGALCSSSRSWPISAAPNAHWLIADFCLPEKTWRRLRERFLIALMYFFFRVVSGSKAASSRRLPAVSSGPSVFRSPGATLSPNEMIHSEFWRRDTPSG